MLEVGFDGIGQHFPDTDHVHRKGTPISESSPRLNARFTSRGVIAAATAFLRRIFLDAFVLLTET